MPQAEVGGCDCLFGHQHLGTPQKNNLVNKHCWVFAIFFKKKKPLQIPTLALEGHWFFHIPSNGQSQQSWLAEQCHLVARCCTSQQNG